MTGADRDRAVQDALSGVSALAQVATTPTGAAAAKAANAALTLLLCSTRPSPVAGAQEAALRDLREAVAVLSGEDAGTAPTDAPAPLPRGILIAFEGIDGSGKSTQLRRVADALGGAGLPVTRTREPTNGVYGARLRRSASEGRFPVEDEFAVFLADRAEHVVSCIQPSLEAGHVVLVDRYYLSSVAYQGARGMDPSEVLRMNEAFAPRPDLVVLLDVPARVGLARARSRDARQNYFEQAGELVLAREIYIHTGLASTSVMIIDGQIDPAQITGKILDAIFNGPLLNALDGDVGKVEEMRERLERFTLVRSGGAR